ncbi:Mannan endo-1,6-alpha-mannosidase [Pleurostoma richardsiae]|uniref:Mannan endo-1,6-alpha-mannosidase n=1 Tax=Pleurostoma richardsiae TaxID=41990 RepID=A0AA38RHS2_9PEZI|nr:Mannan endo-1,6-alpha-mannosidase [Pleurostoma richardsiae]
MKAGHWVIGLCAAPLVRAALDADATSADSLKTAAKSVAYNLMTYYKGNESGMTPGILPGPPPDGDYYWWEGGALWGTMVDYWLYTNDTTYVNLTEGSLVFQAGDDANYMPANWTASLGNDDQGFWGMSAMLAAEAAFQNPPDSDPQYLALAQAVFNTQAARWDTEECNGGLRWQIFVANNGYNYKNSIAQAIFFNIGSRLARYTGNATYADWAEKAFDWTKSVGYIDDSYNVYDGGHTDENCTDINKAQFSYTAAALIQGCGFMYNYTNGSSVWADHLTNLVNRTLDVFFPDGIAVEVACELDSTVQCTADMLSYKGYLHRWLAMTTKMAPFISTTLMPVLETSAKGALTACNTDGTCGFRWTTGSYDGDTGAGQQMNALGAIMSLLITLEDVTDPVTAVKGGTSTGNPDAGSGSSSSSSSSDDIATRKITTGDRAGAGILTALVLVGMSGIFLWMSLGD